MDSFGTKRFLGPVPTMVDTPDVDLHSPDTKKSERQEIETKSERLEKRNTFYVWENHVVGCFLRVFVRTFRQTPGDIRWRAWDDHVNTSDRFPYTDNLKH